MLNSITSTVRNDWTKDEISSIYNMPFMELIYRAATVHRMHFNPLEVGLQLPDSISFPLL